MFSKFSIPKLPQLIDAGVNLVANYKVVRTELDQQRFFASYRASTSNPERLEDAQSIQQIAEYIKLHKFSYSQQDESLKYHDYHNDVAPFLKSVISGAFLLELITITQTYTFSSVKDGSALGKIILDLFQIRQLSDVPPDTLRDCLINLQRFIETLNIATNQKWHPVKSNEDIIKQITDQLSLMPETSVSSSTP